jgi:NADH dehydrogenase FAD-containing subunit
MQEYALPLNTLGDALHFRNRVMVRLEQAELEDNPQIRHSSTTFIVVGGGSGGVEVKAALPEVGIVVDA